MEPEDILEKAQELLELTRDMSKADYRQTLEMLIDELQLRIENL